MVRKRALFITIDYHKDDEIKESFSIASILSYCKNKCLDWETSTISINANGDVSKELERIRLRLSDNDYIFFGLYTWSQKYALQIISYKMERNVFIFGGYNVCSNNIQKLQADYPLVDHFVIGYAEESIYRLISGYTDEKMLNHTVEKENLGSIYTNEILKFDKSIRTIRFYSKLGCLYQCEYCAHRDVNSNQLLSVPLDKVKRELDYIKELDIHKVNFIDPTFNLQTNYLEVTKYLVVIQFPFLVSLQVSFNLITDEFLDLCANINCVLEFGIQDIDETITENVKRKQDIQLVNSVVSKLNSRGIKHEISFIYGLPYQTIDSIENDINWVKDHIDHKLCKVVFNRLMLLPGTVLFNRKSEYSYVEEEINGIPFIMESKWIKKDEMISLIDRLKKLDYVDSKI